MAWINTLLLLSGLNGIEHQEWDKELRATQMRLARPGMETDVIQVQAEVLEAIKDANLEVFGNEIAAGGNAIEAQRSSSGIVLVVEDNVDLFQVPIKRELEGRGYTVITANSVEDARKLIEGMTSADRSLIDLVISDHNMGAETGFDFLKSVVPGQLPNAKKILFSMEGSSERFLKADKLYGITVISKDGEDPIVALMQEVSNQIGTLLSTAGVGRASSTVGTPVGGIDFDPSLLNLQIKRNGKGVPLPLPQQNLENINIDGLYPVIINMQPATIQNFPFLLSKAETEKEPELAVR